MLSPPSGDSTHHINNAQRMREAHSIQAAFSIQEILRFDKFKLADSVLEPRHSTET
jgi:hypothetical protein